MTSQYKKFTQLIAKWPVDVTKGDRDLGKVIRDKIKVAIESKDFAQLDSQFCNKQYNSLNRLANNQHKNKYKRAYNSSATSLSPDECKLVLSNEVLTFLKEENKGFFRKIFNKD